MVTQANGAIVEVEKEYFDSLLAIKTIFKFPQKGNGFTFLASYTIPRKNFSIVLKVQCYEHGVTGMRECVVVSLEGKLDDFEIKKGWFSDPYDPEFKAPLLANKADREEYDQHFPKHPLSRARNTLKMLKRKVGFSDEIVASPKFFSDFE